MLNFIEKRAAAAEDGGRHFQSLPIMQKPETTPMCRHGFDDLSLERIRSQLGGAVIMGLGLAMRGKMTLKPSPPRAAWPPF